MIHNVGRYDISLCVIASHLFTQLHISCNKRWILLGLDLSSLAIRFINFHMLSSSILSIKMMRLMGQRFLVLESVAGTQFIIYNYYILKKNTVILSQDPFL
jgi:hypothetical protein